MKKITKNLIGLAAGVVLLAVTGVLGAVFGAFDEFGDVVEMLHFEPQALVKSVIIIAFLYALNCLLQVLFGLAGGAEGRKKTMLTVIASLLKYAIFIIGFCWVLTAIGVNVSTIFASIGVIALILGFGAESLIEDVITGLFILFENQYNVGDIVEIGSFRGTVTEVGIRTTSITDLGGNIKIINNSNMKDILNRSHRESKSIAEVQVAYSTDMPELEKKLPYMMEDIFDIHKDIMKSVPAYVGVQELGENGVTLRFVVEVDEQNIFNAQRAMNRELLVMLQKEGIEIPYRQVDIHQR